MSGPIDLQARIEAYLAVRRRQGFSLRNMELTLASFAQYVAGVRHQGALTVELMAEWARQDSSNTGKPETWARRLMGLRPFMRYLRQFDPRTEVPDESVFGAVPGRQVPHIYHEEEIIDLLASARELDPCGGLRPATYETLLGLLASTGLRISEALNLLDTDVDLKSALLTVRRTKFTKSRQLPLHSTTVAALQRYRRLRARYLRTTAETRFFVGSRGKWLGQPLSDRQVHRVFRRLRTRLGWVSRGAHEEPRIHDLRHSFAVRRLMLWYAQGVDIDQAMLALSTYLGHVKISSTYWYLTGVPELMVLAGDKFERFAKEGRTDDE